jgi:hypothetical protein
MIKWVCVFDHNNCIMIQYTEETMSKKTISLIAIIGGVLLSLISLTADFIGIGSYPGINYAQLAGIAVGLVIILVGLRLRRSKVEKS